MIDLEALKAKAKAVQKRPLGVHYPEVYKFDEDMVTFKNALSPDVVIRLIERIETMRKALEKAVTSWGDYVPNPNSNAAKVLKECREALKAGEK